MECKFIGVGDAFDGKHINTSLFVKIKNKSVLFDCGFNAAHSFFELVPSSLELDIVWISHFHGDHFFGLPVLFGSFHSSGRQNDLIVCGPLGIEKKVTDLVNLAYPNLLGKLSFKLVFQEFYAGDSRSISGINFSAGEIDHSVFALAVRIDHDGYSLFYSGDGLPSPNCSALVSGVDLAVLEAYHLNEAIVGHSSVKQCLDLAHTSKINKVALVHLNRFVRTYHLDEILELINEVKDVEVLLPEEGYLLHITHD